MVCGDEDVMVCGDEDVMVCGDEDVTSACREPISFKCVSWIPFSLAYESENVKMRLGKYVVYKHHLSISIEGNSLHRQDTYIHSS